MGAWHGRVLDASTDSQAHAACGIVHPAHPDWRTWKTASEEAALRCVGPSEWAATAHMHSEQQGCGLWVDDALLVSINDHESRHIAELHTTCGFQFGGVCYLFEVLIVSGSALLTGHQR